MNSEFKHLVKPISLIIILLVFLLIIILVHILLCLRSCNKKIESCELQGN